MVAAESTRIGDVVESRLFVEKKILPRVGRKIEADTVGAICGGDDCSFESAADLTHKRGGGPERATGFGFKKYIVLQCMIPRLG